MTDAPPRTPTQAPAVTGALSFDAQDYLHFLEDCDWTEDQKREFIEILWQIIVSFVDLGFDLHPIQKVINSADALEDDSSEALAREFDLKAVKDRDRTFRGTARENS